MSSETQSNTRHVLGVAFFNGSVSEAVRTMSENGGLLVVPAAPALVNIQYDAAYRQALIESDVAIADSGFMVLLWRFMQQQNISRISGLAYLKELLDQPQLRTRGSVFLVMPTKAAGEKALSWLQSREFEIDVANSCVAPRYAAEVVDPDLARLLNEQRPAHVIIGLGGGVQEKLGFYLRETLEYRPAIHCIGAALGFLTGDQKSIPDWADQLYLGWFLRLAREPRLFFRRFWVAHELPALIWRYGAQVPPLRQRPV